MELAKAGTRSPRGRQIGGRLKALRAEAEVTVAQLQVATGVGKSTINRIEAGGPVSHQSTLRALFGYFGISGQELADILALAAAGSKSSGGWLQAYSDEISDDGYDFIAFEGAAAQLLTFESTFVPGLLQTEDYARAVIQGMDLDSTPEAVDRRVEIRRRRQAVLTQDDPVNLDVVLSEAVLCPLVGSPKIMADQLVSLTQLPPHVRVAVVPFGAGVHAGMAGSFVYMRFANSTATDLVYVESPVGAVFREAEPDLKRVLRIFGELKGRALTAEDSAVLIKSAARRHRRGTT